MVELPDHYCQQHYAHEAEYRANRQRWARARSKQYQHKYNTVTRHRNSGKTMQYDFYRTKQWHDLRQQALDRDHYVCRYCGKPNSSTVDHVVPIEYDKQLMTSLENLATTCRKCHHLKTQWERQYYGTGAGNTLKKVPEVKNTMVIKNIIRRMASD